MRVLIYKHCANIRFGNKKETNGGNSEIHIIVDNLKKSGHEVGVISIERYEEDSKGKIDRFFVWDHFATAIGWADVVLCFNGLFNAFGGVVSEESLLSYRILNSCNKPFIYAVTDTAIPLGDLHGWITNNQSKGKNTDLISDAYKFDPKKIYCLTQVYDLEQMKKIWKDDTNGFGAYGHFPFEMTALFRQGLHSTINENPTNDLIYFGNARGGKRDKKFHKFYFGHGELKVDVYGNGWKEEKFPTTKNNVSFLGKIDMYELAGKINSSIAHCYISDPKNEGTIWTTRFYEAIMNRCVLFVDIDNDPDMQRFKDPFFYVHTAEELSQKIKLLKNNPSMRIQKLMDQYSAMKSHLELARDFPRVLNFYLNAAKDHHATYIQKSTQQV